MIIKENEKLDRYVTFRIGGYTSKLFIPETEEELMLLIKEFISNREKYYILGNGSNILVKDTSLKRKVILNKQACCQCNFKKDGIVEVGSSVDIRKLIKLLIEQSLESPVALYTIPATVGGAIFQNANRKSFHTSISDNLLNVRYFDGEVIRTITKENCRFSWRYSIFHEHRNWTILSAAFQFKQQSREVNEKRLKESIEAAVNKSYRKQLSAGSVFKTTSTQVLKSLKGLRIGDAEFSPTTLNTIHNLGEAKFNDIERLIFIGKLAHWLRLKKVELEIEIWE